MSGIEKRSAPGIMRKFRINELSGVDVPAQGAAVAVIMKRAGEPGSGADNEGEAMSSEIKKALGLAETATDADVAAAIAKRDEDIAKANAERDEAIAKASMTDATRAHYSELAKGDKEKAKAFLAMSEEDRQKEVKKAAEGDETVQIEGRTISKRAVGDDVFEIMKAQAERITKNEEDIRKAREATADATFAKQASTDFAHLAGTTEERASVLKFIATAPEDVRKAADAIFKAAEASAKLAFSKVGGRGGNPEAADAEGEIQKRAKEYQKADPKLSDAEAYDKVLQTPEGAALYAKSLSGKEAQTDAD